MPEIIYKYVKGQGWVPEYDKPKRRFAKEDIDKFIERELRRVALEEWRRVR